MNISGSMLASWWRSRDGRKKIDAAECGDQVIRKENNMTVEHPGNDEASR